MRTANVPARKQAKLNAELARLETMSPAELRAAWEAQEGSVPPNVAAPLLRRLLGQRMQERQLGGLPALVVRELGRLDGIEVRLALRRLLPHCPERWPLELYRDAAAQENEIGRAQGVTAAFNGIVRQLRRAGRYEDVSAL